MKPKNIETSYGKFPTMIHYENYWKDKVSKTFSDGQDDILNTLKSFDWKGKDVKSTKLALNSQALPNSERGGSRRVKADESRSDSDNGSPPDTFDTESEKKIEAHTKVSIDAYDKGVEHGKMFSEDTKGEHKGCGIFLYEDQFEDPEDLFDHDVFCGARLIRDNKQKFCEECQEDRKPVPNKAYIEKAVNITKDGFDSIRSLVQDKEDRQSELCGNCNHEKEQHRGKGCLFISYNQGLCDCKKFVNQDVSVVKEKKQ